MAVVMDFRDGRISNRLICAGLIWGLACRMMGDGRVGIVHFLVNISIPVILLFLLFQMRALGAGDIKLFSMTGGFLSARQLLFIIAGAFLCGAVIGLGKLLYERKKLSEVGTSKTFIHFSMEILLAYFIIVWGCAVG